MRGSRMATTYRGHPSKYLTPTSRIRAFLSFTLHPYTPCQCCLREEISIGNFHAGHILAHVNGGLSTLDNLVPICMLCNTSMGAYNLNDFIKKYNLHHGL